ncbi:unnamed protein product [Parnassius mnemosyne]|uniref:Uncharacterized protein n=1 Tax=Parnassius mnemosyne TaxID=213953 RepID=A0AAV1MBV6_9NEOP
MNLSFKGCSLHEALAIVEEDEELEVPLLAIVSDQDSGGEEGGGLTNILTDHQLNGESEVVFASTSL